MRVLSSLICGPDYRHFYESALLHDFFSDDFSKSLYLLRHGVRNFQLVDGFDFREAIPENTDQNDLSPFPLSKRFESDANIPVGTYAMRAQARPGFGTAGSREGWSQDSLSP